MKKLFIALVGGTMFFTSCTNENSVNPTTIELSKAIITGTVYAELDNTVTGKEKAPAGTKVVARISTESLVTNPGSGNYAYRYYETTVDGTGKYTIEVETGNREVYVDVIPADFIADVKGVSATTKNNFYGSNAADYVYVYKNGTFILDLSY